MTVKCPKCQSEHVVASRQGYAVGTAAVATALLGPPGLVAGVFGRKKVFVSCAACGHSWDPAKANKLIEKSAAKQARAEQAAANRRRYEAAQEAVNRRKQQEEADFELAKKVAEDVTKRLANRPKPDDG